MPRRLPETWERQKFGVLPLALRAPPDVFRTAWVVESLLTELAILLVVRTHGPVFKSRPSADLLAYVVANEVAKRTFLRRIGI